MESPATPGNPMSSGERAVEVLRIGLGIIWALNLLFIAIATGYLAVAFLVGFTTRLACVIGTVASAFFLWTQYTTTFAFPGETDVGPHPLYLAMYVILLVGGAGRYWSVDRRLWRSGRTILRKLGRWVAGPRP